MDGLWSFLVMGAVVATVVLIVAASAAVIVFNELRRQRVARSSYAVRLAEYRRAVHAAADSR